MPPAAFAHSLIIFEQLIPFATASSVAAATIKSFESNFPDCDQAIKNRYSGEIAFITKKDFRSRLIDKIKLLDAENVKSMNVLH